MTPRHTPRFAVALVACLLASWTAATRAADPLAAWNDGAARAHILAFVAAVTAPGGRDFVPPPDRIAVFDNHRTLCPFGRLDRALDEAGRRGWLVVSMKNDWRSVYGMPR